MIKPTNDKDKVLSNLADVIDRLCFLSGLFANDCAEIMKCNDLIIIEDCIDKLKPLIKSINGRGNE